MVADGASVCTNITNIMIVYLGEEGIFEGEELRLTLYGEHRIFTK